MSSPPRSFFDVLEWDSDLFGFPVAQLRRLALRPDVLTGALRTLRDRKVRLAYAMMPWDDRESRAAVEQVGGLLVDHRVRYRKAVSERVMAPADVETWLGLEGSAELEALALESGHQSRFRIDPSIPPHVFPQLYLTWIRRSVRREIAQAVLVSRAGEALTGLVTLDLKASKAVVGLMAVHGAHRREGVGLRLMAAAEAWSHAHEAETLEIVTQGANTAACTLYEVSGCVRAEEEAIYHVWLESGGPLGPGPPDSA